MDGLARPLAELGIAVPAAQDEQGRDGRVKKE